MALKTLSTFLSPLSLPKSKFPQHLLTTKPGLVLCEFSRSQKSRLPADESEGTGAAAPSPGEKFLERQQSYEAAKIILKENKKRKKKKDNAVKASRNVASCYGCGAPLHTSDAVAPGYVDPETYELKKKHHQLRTVLCRRCQLLSHGEMITAVGGHGGYPGGKLFVTAEELREKLAHLRHEKALIVKLVDIVDFHGSFLSRVRDLAGSNPIILVVTKVDLLPRDTDLNCVGDWVVEATMRKKLKYCSQCSSHQFQIIGWSNWSDIRNPEREEGKRCLHSGKSTNWKFDILKQGSANVGKSAFINALLKTMAINDPVAASAQRYKPIQSAVPGTTLGPIQINAFLGGGKLYDTPGVHLHHRQTAVVQSKDLPSLAPRSRLRGISFPVLPETCLTFYGPKGLQIHMVPTEKADEFYQKELGVLLTPPSGGENIESWKGLESERKLQIKFEDVERPACDIAISGLGWFTVEPVGRSRKISQSKPVETTEELILVVRVPKPVEIFVRPPIPVGKAGAEWYQYVELTEKEEEMRPKWYF
ncbi:NO-associated protein 1, chloroplastic/mitochondrial isoform X3 [Vigna angularis]|uniref:NO-associated protein 1, chloroplastic/mitochondrial isoform X3 n=1 Tax=Phaseolus angularis TaxID=3914 RepID=UPI0022B3A1A1|nr:NO-associated protein 1, chloroplastic/mitochondrial isoform X3 [Vigna angularis]